MDKIWLKTFFFFGLHLILGQKPDKIWMKIFSFGLHLILGRKTDWSEWRNFSFGLHYSQIFWPSPSKILRTLVYQIVGEDLFFLVFTRFRGQKPFNFWRRPFWGGPQSNPGTEFELDSQFPLNWNDRRSRRVFLCFYSAVFQLTSAKFQTFAYNSRTVCLGRPAWIFDSSLRLMSRIFVPNFEAIGHVTLVLGPKTAPQVWRKKRSQSKTA